MKRVAICGGGNIAHVLAAVVGAVSDQRCAVLTRRPEHWPSRVRAELRDHAVEGLILATADPAEAMSGADLVLISAPAFAHRQILSSIAPHLTAHAWVCALPGSGGFDRCALEILPTTIGIAGSARSPYNARVRAPGLVEISGVVPRLEIGVARESLGFSCQNLLENGLGLPVHRLPHYLAVTLCPGGTIFHPARLWEIVARQAPQPESFYGDWGDEASRVYLACDAELEAIRSGLGLTGLGLSAREHYGVDEPQDLTRRIRDLTGLPGIPAPRLRNGVLDSQAGAIRFLTEDVPYGLMVAERFSASELVLALEARGVHAHTCGPNEATPEYRREPQDLRLRFSPHYYNTSEEIDQATEVLEALVKARR